MRRIADVLGLLAGLALMLAGLVLQSTWGAICWALTGAGIFMMLIFLVRLLLSSRRRTAPSENSESEQERILPEYRRKKSMLSRSEHAFLQVLRSAVDLEKYEIVVQVPLIAVIDKLTQNSYRNELFRVADYCVVERATYAPLLLIELNDASHNRADRIERDRKVNEICQRAALPLLTFDQSAVSDVSTVRKALNKMLKSVR